MNHSDHVALLRKGITQPGGVWADLGAGQGAFTLALAELLGPTATIYAVDQSGSSLRQLKRAMDRQFPDVQLHLLQADFTHDLDLPLLDGLVMANSLHFVANQDRLIPKMRGLLKNNGRFLIVEYNEDRGNRWVPYPVSYTNWQTLAQHHGFQQTELLATRPSRFLGEIYAAASWATT
jgi:ubiquinone/menaquinone biosynthesis C-methylase UbiE